MSRLTHQCSGSEDNTRGTGQIAEGKGGLISCAWVDSMPPNHILPEILVGNLFGNMTISGIIS